ncbi:MAG: lysine--tRNA ligase [archaeon]
MDGENVYWTDSLAREFSGKGGKFVINDAKTPSGIVHVGSLRGVIIHDAIRRSFSAAGLEAEFFYEFDDMDAFDRMNAGLPPEFEGHLGKPFCRIPSPEQGYPTFGKCYAERFARLFPILGAKARIFYLSELYSSGKLNGQIRTALDNAAKINEINERVSGAKKDELPFQPICEKCGKIGSTSAYEWSGETVKYRCLPNKVEWAKGCGHEGALSPFNGNGKLPWKVEWAARWPVLGVNVELAGKDHYTKTGSRAVSDVLADEVFGYAHPYGFGYEFFLIGGRKMSTSKGLGVSAEESVRLIPPVLLRFLLIKTRPRAQLDFDPSGYTLIRLFDEYDKYERIYFGLEPAGSGEENVRRIYELSQVSGEVPGEIPKNVPFSHAVTLAQIFERDSDAVEKLGIDSPELRERLSFAREWVGQGYAPEEIVFSFKGTLPAEARRIGAPARAALRLLADFVEGSELARIREVPALAGCKPAEFFEAFYLAVFGKTKGPRLATLVGFIDREKLVKRLREA